MFSKMTKATAHVVEIAIILGILILINILASDMHARWDLTEDKQFTLHESSRRIVADLKDELRVTLYSSIQFRLPGGTSRRHERGGSEEASGQGNQSRANQSAGIGPFGVGNGFSCSSYQLRRR